MVVYAVADVEEAVELRSIGQPRAAILHEHLTGQLRWTALTGNYCYPFAGEYLLAVGRDHDKAVRVRSGGDIARSLPGDEFDLRVFVLAGKNGGKEARRVRT